MSFFSSHEDYLQHDNRVAFASDMTQNYRFLFDDCAAEDHMVSQALTHGLNA